MSSHIITGSRSRIVSTPIHVPFTISRESLPKADIVTIEITTASGLTGLGECSPFPSLTHDDVTTAQREAQQLLQLLTGLDIDTALDRLATLLPTARQRSITATVGVECALWDLKAQVQAKPLAALFGPIPTTSIETDITLPIMTPEAIPNFWRLYEPYGFSTIKVKVAGAIASDLAMLNTLRSVVPPSTRYILDGNQGCTVDTALRLLDNCRELGLDVLFFEQPLPERDLDSLRTLSSRASKPICVDETVRTASDLSQLLDLGIKPIVNIKIMKSGVAEALKIIALARQSDCPLMIGGMLESEIAMGFSLHIACGTGAFSYADLDTPFFFTQRLTKSSPWHSHAARLELPPEPGLGIQLLSLKT